MSVDQNGVLQACEGAAPNRSSFNGFHCTLMAILQHMQYESNTWALSLCFGSCHHLASHFMFLPVFFLTLWATISRLNTPTKLTCCYLVLNVLFVTRLAILNRLELPKDNIYGRKFCWVGDSNNCDLSKCEHL